MRAALACLAVGSLVACGGGGGGAAKPKQPIGPAIDAKKAEQGASDLITEIYETLDRGNSDSLFTLLEDKLIVFGPRPTDMLGTRADALVALGQVIDPKTKRKLAIKMGKLEVVAAPGGRSAWAFDTAYINGQPHTVMAVLTNADDLWLVETVAVAHTPPAGELKAELAKDAVAPPGGAGTRKVDPAAKAAVDKFQRGLLDQAAWGDELASRTDAIFVGPTAGEVARGKKEIKATWKKRVAAKTRAAISGEITAAVTRDGQLAWVSAPITRVEGEGTQPLPLRAFAVYENRGGDWKLIALDESAAVGAPGAGAAFKRILPPKPAEPKPEVIADKKDKDKGAKDKGAKDKGAKDKGKKSVKKKKEDEDAAPKKKKPKRSFSRSDDDEDEAPKKVKAAKADDEEEPSRDAPKKAKAKAEEDEAPKKKKLAKGEEEEEEAPKKKKPAKAKAEAEEEEAPKRSRSLIDAIDDQPAKKGKAKPPAKRAAKKGKAKPAEEAPKKPAAEDENIEVLE